jgi:hypothetical protein
MQPGQRSKSVDMNHFTYVDVDLDFDMDLHFHMDLDGELKGRRAESDDPSCLLRGKPPTMVAASGMNRPVIW